MILHGSEETLDLLKTTIRPLQTPSIVQNSDGMNYEGITGSFNVNSFNRIIHTTILDDDNQVLRWLSLLEPQGRHQHLRQSRLEGVGKWIFRTTEFRKWDTEDGSSDSVLFCHGDPGVGKTHLSSVVIDHFYSSGQDITVAGLYCDYFDRKEQTTSSMLGAMLKQLVGRGNIPEEIYKAFEGAKGHFGGVGPQVPELLKMLKLVIAQRRRVVICIDGLDESLAAHRTGLLSALQVIVQELPNVRLFLTGRPFIHSEIESYFDNMGIISVSPTKQDTQAFLRMKLGRDPEPDAMDERLRADIMRTIPKTISEIFLLVSLSIETILGETTIHRRREKLKQMSSGQDVGDVYTATFERIRAQGEDRARLGMDAIMWIAHSERPLEPDELCQALGVELGSTDLNSDNAPSIRTILNCTLGLVAVDSSSSRVRLVHFTLQEHILANPTLFRSSHSIIAEVCLTYLNFRCIKDLSPTLSSPPPTTPFLQYASCYWGTHARRETSASLIPLALKLLDRFDAHISCTLLLWKEIELGRPLARSPFDIAGNPSGFTGLHGGALLGVLEIMVSLLQVKIWDLNAIDLCGNTVLMLATKGGHDGIVKVLLEQGGANPDMTDSWGQTPLSLAIAYRHEGIARMLLERNDVNPNTRDRSGQTPLLWATGTGRERTVQLLLERSDLDPNMPDKDGRTPLSWAAQSWCAEIVRMLLGRNDVNPNTADESGRTPFSWAAGAGRKRAVRLLLERSDIDPNRADKSGRTPFSWAAGNGRERVVRLLLERNDVDPDRANKSGRTPLSWAAIFGHGEIVKMLLSQSDVNPDSADEGGRTPLSWATKFRRRGVVKMLLERNNVNPNTADENGRTPLLEAAGSGYEEIVELLLGRNDVNPKTPDKGGRTPLSWAARTGRERVVKLLLERNDANLGTADESGRTPLSWAAGSGYQRVAELLLGRDDVDPNRADESGRTPFSWAAESPRVEIVRMLLGRHGVNPNTADKAGRTPFSWAAGAGHKRNIKLLLERNDVDPNAADKSGRTPLSFAAMAGRGRVVKLLLRRNDVNPHVADESGRTPFSWAAMFGHAEVVSMLPKENKVNPNTADESGWTLFSCTPESGQERVVDMLPERNNVNSSMADESSQTPIPWPTENGCARVSQWQEEWHDFIDMSEPREESSEPSTAEPSPPPEPPLKKIRLF